ncbi:PilN domain-containing protein [Massilia yuzhufengensis]|uniref:Tfp pilus assembly protein PilN n=1 Tax=Massilia yuzhufengensis TaxID=1164594 RepID=A0A1I1WJT2_9BURK|nr:PilN domain-containing protein [Massilia yuzhufengensis]SFD95406.1 Tfp pilus assembly protein PilN [Massilia yuzhufengensis]
MNPPLRQQVNLFNPALLPQKKVLTARMMGLSLLLLVAGIGALGAALRAQTASMQEEAAIGAGQLSRKQARLASVKAEFAPRGKNATLASEITEADNQLAALRHVSGVLQRGELGDTNGYAGYLKAFARQGLTGLWLTSLSIAGKDIGIKGRTTDPALVPGYISRLTQEPLLQGKSFASLQIGQAAPLQSLDADGKPVRSEAPYVEFSLQAVPEAPRP